MYSGIIPIIKQAAVDAVNATQPVQFVFGKVTSVSPLTVQVTPKLTLGAANLVICDSLTKKEIDIVVKGNTGKVEAHSHTFSDTSTSDGGHSHDLSSGSAKSGGSHTHGLSGSTKTSNSHSHELSSGSVTSSGSTHSHDLSGSTKSVSGHTHEVSGTTGNNGGHDHTVEIPVTITIDNSLKKGDSVILARMQGGNKYLVLDKAVDA